MSLQVQYLPLYNDFSQHNQWDQFASPSDDFITPLSRRAADFSIQERDKSLWDAAHQITLFVAKIIIFPWGLYCLARYTVQRIAMLPLYPLQSRIVQFFAPVISEQALNAKRQKEAAILSRNGFIVRDVSLEKNGVRYSGLLMGHRDTITNGKWALQATGNGEPIEYAAVEIAEIYNGMEFNTLMINGPAVGRSEGQATPDSMGDAQEVGISFIETALKADKMVIAGRSLGGAAIGQAILKHEFKDDVDYLVIQQMTFDRTSNISGRFLKDVIKLESEAIMFFGNIIDYLPGCSPNGTQICGPTIQHIFTKIILPLVSAIIKWSGCEMVNAEASRKLQALGIKEVIVQASHRDIPDDELPDADDFITDGMISAEASHGRGLICDGVTDNKVFLCLPHAHHMTNNAIWASIGIILDMS